MRLSRLAIRSMTPALACLAVSLACAVPALAGATITIRNNDGVNEGFNDPTPLAPVGGNTGTTLGQQRLIAFQHAADLWGAVLDSNVGIVVRANFNPQTCTATSAVLGSAGTSFIFANFGGAAPFPGAAFPNTWHHSALADKRAGAELNPGVHDISATFNSNLNGNPACLGGIGWYLGLDGSHGPNIDLVTVVLHEIGHGLGFSQFASITTGSQIQGLTDVYGRNLLDTTTGLTWDQMTNGQRVASAVNTRRVCWIGSEVGAAAPGVLVPGTPLLRVNPPSSIAGIYAVGAAAFGPPLDSTGVSGDVVRALDPADGGGPTTFDACSPLTNAPDVSGKVALVDRGTCSFVLKALNVQAAGAIAMIVADNVAGSPPAGMGGADPTITIPSVRVSLADGNAIKGAIAGGVNASMLVDLSVLAGADDLDRPLMYTPSPLQQGSTISHWDTIASPNQLMEPAINADLTHNLSGVDLTLALMRDVGWFADADVDGLDDGTDNCPADGNPGQEDLDGDGIGDVCDDDVDGDGVANVSDLCPVDVPHLGLDADADGCTDTLNGLKALVAQLPAPPFYVNGLLAKLSTSGMGRFSPGEDAFLLRLDAFILHVEGLRVVVLDEATADMLVAYASNLKTLLTTP